MISIVLYGRNDSYGYNLHKRAALSLNCMAEVLSDPSDEILFVDYNTPDDFPTFPEAIQDTLTKRARGLLRILRVRPRLHDRFKSKTHLVALEPVARNVAIRRSNPSNRWILSTNTDMIFVPRAGGSLSKIAADLAPGFYHAPRIEIPEVLWESFDRGAPVNVIDTVRDWGSALHLNEIILGSNYILYDGPGDFQLLLRSDLFENQGFHEGMLLGWHVDSNMAKRMYIKYGMVGDLGKEVYGYHCDHTRQVTPAHSHTRLQNDWRMFCAEVERPDIPELAETWGCVNDTIEEVRLLANPASVYVQGLRDAIGSPLGEAPVVKYTHETYNKISYDSRHVLPFLADMFVSMPRSSNLAWYGAGVEILSRFATVWEKLGFTGKILADRDLIQHNDFAAPVCCVPSADLLDAADVFVFDFGDLPGSPHDGRGAARKQLSDDLLRRFQRVVRAERRRLSDGLTPRRLIALNAINNQYEGIVSAHVAAAATPCATHMRHGYALPTKAKDDWLPQLDIGQAGVRVGDRLVNSNPRKLGFITYGPYKYLDEGRYRLSIKVDPPVAKLNTPRNEQCMVVEVWAGPELLGVYLIRRQDLRRSSHEFFFDVSPTVADTMHGIETKIKLLARLALTIRSVIIEPMPASTVAGHARAAEPLLPALRVGDWLPYLFVGPLGRAEDLGVLVRRGRPEHAAFGPYWPLPVGRYQLTAKFELMSGDKNASHVRADVTAESGARALVSANFSLTLLPRDDNDGLYILRLPFNVRSQKPEQRLIETRFWSSGQARFRIRSLSMTPRVERDREDVYPFLLAGEVGTRRQGKLQNVGRQAGFTAYSQAIEVEPGHYRLLFRVAFTGDELPSPTRPCAIARVKQGPDILAVTPVAFDAAVNAEHELIFDVLSESDFAEIEFLFQAVGGANVVLSSLLLDPLGPATQGVGSAVCRLENWLPFMQLKPGAHLDADGVIVSEGYDDFCVYGPFWTLPAGRYEMIASIVPDPSGRATNPVLTGDVAAAGGTPLFAAGKWRLGQYQLADADASIEFRLPFTLADDLPAELRTIETRVYRQGNGGFRIRSLAVKVRSDEVERNWFPYLAVGECGLHTGREIKSDGVKPGSIASTPPMAIPSGHYKLSPDIGTARAERHRACVALEVWSGQDVIAFTPLESGNDQALEFYATEEVARRGIKVRIHAIAPTMFSISGLTVERTSESIAPHPVPAVLKLQDWLPFLQLRPRAHADADGIFVSEGEDDFPIYGPFWTLPAGRYEMIASIVPDLSNQANNPLITGQVAGDCGKRIFASGKWHLGQFQPDDGYEAIEVHIPFTLPDHLPAESRAIETRIFSPGNASFRIRSVVVKVRNNESEGDWFTYLTVAESGIHTGRAIKSVGNKFGCIARTPLMDIAHGHYKLVPDVVDVSPDRRRKARIGIEIWSGSEPIAKETVAVGRNQPLDFDVTEAISAKGVELRICAITPAVVSIRGLLIEKTSDAIGQKSFRPAVNRIKRLLRNSLIVGPAKPLKSLPKLCARAYTSAISKVRTSVSGSR